MKTQRTHLLALRAASQVTAVSRAFCRVAVGTAASAVLLTGAGGCSSTSSSGSAVDATVGENDIAEAAKASDIILDIRVADMGVASDLGSRDETIVIADILVADVLPDAAELPETCLIPNGKACSTREDCSEPESWGQECIDGECHDADMSSEAAMACCQAQYEAGNFGVPGCNPWGPPAPPADRGYRLTDFADLVEIA